jgi:hypothetical protein
MKIWSWTVDDWNAAFQILPIVFVALTVLTGAGKFWTDRIIKGRQAQQLADAKTSAARVQDDLATQQQRAAKAEKELSEIKERFQPRTLTENQKNNIFGLARAYSSIAKEARKKRGEFVMIIHPRGDPEATEYASMITHLFFEAGWPVQIEDMPFPVHTTGISLLVSDPSNPPTLLRPLQTIFEQAGIPVTVRKEQHLDKKIFMQVGSKH